MDNRNRTVLKRNYSMLWIFREKDKKMVQEEVVVVEEGEAVRSYISLQP